MKRLKTLFTLFCLVISIPLAFVIWQTYRGVARDERSQLRFFSETLLDDMQAVLSKLVQREENRAVDEYHHTMAGTGQLEQLSPLAEPPREDYIFGYLQNNPDGSFQTPLVADMGRVPTERREAVEQLKQINTIFNRKKFALPKQPSLEEKAEATSALEVDKVAKDDFAQRYVARSKQKVSKRYLGKKTQRIEQITADQALNLSREDESLLSPGQLSGQGMAPQTSAEIDVDDTTAPWSVRPGPSITAQAPKPQLEDSTDPNRFQVEVAPLQSVQIDNERFFIFRRIVVNNQIYRQGFVVEARPLLQYLAQSYFASQPMAGFSRLSLQIDANGASREVAAAGTPPGVVTINIRRSFPAPFDFCSAVVQAGTIPSSPARRTLNVALAVFGFFTLLGLFLIHRSVRAIVEVSERRSQFVSSVTHELKTPLTNIRMYIEMLEQGIAANPEREHDYFQILESESSRLSRLVNNVLELSKLEKKQRHLNMQPGTLETEFNEVEKVMAPKLKQEGFSLTVEPHQLPPFLYDSEVMIQILINLIENSIKFGRQLPQQCITVRAESQQDRVRITVSDTGPGIPRRALKKIFGDFYRVDNDLTRTTGGTGIGLALVKKYVDAMKGRVQAVNNEGPGCTIIVSLPATPTTST
jgi:signal transduction histidine kinase